jgi:hypothetical protein
VQQLRSLRLPQKRRNALKREWYVGSFVTTEPAFLSGSNAKIYVLGEKVGVILMDKGVKK